MSTIVYFNNHEDYGDTHRVTIDDYRQMDPDSTFEEDYQWDVDVITRLTDDPSNPFEIVAIGYDLAEIDLDSDDDDQYDNEIVSYPANSPALAEIKRVLREERDNPTPPVTYPDLDAIMTAGEVVEQYSMSNATVRVAISRGQIPARKSGGTWLVHRADVERRWGQRTIVWRADFDPYTEYVLEDGRTIWQIEQPGGSWNYVWKQKVDNVYEYMYEEGGEWVELDDDEAATVIANAE
jgi:excisionase family DNA binding protein